ncbi:unnamed protein product [Acanthoscelides obtectus]|uniref:Uncharacterized protein n=1 Tax=Acanthoscelides obtectus TaxID=200917 RepID=A0A9P0NXD3_ACAOB|nr:unnamed protein product [Acanthoscelides obtectus]CAK1642214.1 hypothetical protein AOBTE_LOCUS12891 [Acanthoscelides obtectus]
MNYGKASVPDNQISGVSTETYRRRILFARVSHLACDILPGDLLAKSLGNTPVEIASTILYKYLWSVLISLAESSDYRTMPKPQYTQKFRDAWLKDLSLKEWLLVSCCTFIAETNFSPMHNSTIYFQEA